MATAAFFDVGDTWTESTPTFTQVQATLKILGGDADVDQYIAKTRSNVQDIEAAVLELKAKAVAHEFEDEFLYDDTAGDPKGFDGLHKLTPGGQQVHLGSGATPAALPKEAGRDHRPRQAGERRRNEPGIPTEWRSTVNDARRRLFTFYTETS